MERIALVYRRSFKGVFRHWKTLLPGSLAFYLPEFLAMQGVDWILKPLVANVIKAVVMIVLIAIALQATAPQSEQFESDTTSYSIQFFIGDMVFWLFLLCLEAPALYYLSVHIPGLEWGQPPPGFWEIVKAGTPGVFAVFGLLSLPPLYAFLRLNFFGFILRQQGGYFPGAWKKSWAMTSGLQVPLAVFYLAMVALLLAGLAAWTVGILFTFPVTLLATARIYRVAAGQEVSES